MKRLLLTVLLLLSTVGVSTAEQIEIRHVSELIEPAEVIARVTILCVWETGAQEGYGKVAYARVTDSIKGLEADCTFEVENYRVNIECPNVSYVEGEDVLLFAKSMKNGHYETVYMDAGKFLIETGAVSKQPFTKGQNYDSARAEIKREVRKIEKGG
jgi:hypothetical protein